MSQASPQARWAPPAGTGYRSGRPLSAGLKTVVCFVLLISGCGGSDTIDPGPTDLALDAETPTALAGEVGDAVAPVPHVLVHRGDTPSPGVEVRFSTAGGGTVSRSSAVTDASGRASPGDWVLGTHPGAQTLTASSPSVAGQSIVFTATAAPGQPTRLAFRVPPSLSAADRPITPAVEVEVTDEFGNPVPSSASVTVGLGGGSGTLAGSLTVAAVNGVATFTDLRLTSAGTGFRLVASAQGLTSATSTPFDIVAGGAAAMAIFAGNAQTGVVGSALAIAPAVKLLDAGGNPVAGVAVTFTAANGGSVAGANATTGADGVARATSWTLGTTAGTQSLTASAAGGGFAGNPLTFNATAAAGPPSSSRSSLQTLKSSVTAGTESAGIRVTVRDQYGNPVSGVTVTLAASGSENQIQQPPATSNGTADGALASTRAEQKTVTASLAGTPIGGSVTVTVNPGPAASITLSPAGLTGITAGATLAVSAVAADQYGNVIANPGLTWSSSRTSVATVSSSGVVTGVAPVSATIRAASGALSATTEVAVYGAMTLDSLPYCSPGGKALTLDMFAPSASSARPAPIAIYIHGGGWVDGGSKGGWQFDSFKSQLLARGYLVGSLNYRLAPGTNGNAMWRAQGQDVACAIRFLRANAVRYGIDPNGIAIWGRSAGGHLGALLGLTNDNFGYATEYPGYSSQVQAVAGLAGVYDITRPSQVPSLVGQHQTADSVFRGWPDDSTSSYVLGASPTRRVGSGGAAFLIIVPEFDTDVLPIQGVTLHNTLVGHSLSSQLLTLQHADHSLEPVAGYSETEPSRAEVVTIIANFFDGALGRGGAASPLASSRMVRTEGSTNVAPHAAQSGARQGSFRIAY